MNCAGTSAPTAQYAENQLMIKYCSTVNDFARTDFNRYQMKVVNCLTGDNVSSLFYGFDMKNELSKLLIAMCVKKGIFADYSNQLVVFTLF